MKFLVALGRNTRCPTLCGTGWRGTKQGESQITRSRENDRLNLDPDPAPGPRVAAGAWRELKTGPGRLDRLPVIWVSSSPIMSFIVLQMLAGRIVITGELSAVERCEVANLCHTETYTTV